MTVSIISASLASVLGEDKITHSHDFLLSGDTIWAFSQQYHDQKSFNWGHRVVHKGGYAVPFNTKSNTWGSPVEFASVYDDENAEEVLFTINDTIYLLVTSAFKDIAAHGLWEWTGVNWEKVSLTAPAALHLHDDNINVKTVVLDSNSTNERYLVFSISFDLRLYRLKFSNKEAELEPVGTIPVQQLQCIAPMAVSGVHSGKRIIISYMTRGCGYMWDSSRFLTYDTEEKKFDHVNVAESSDSREHPPFGQSGGGRGHWLTPGGEWIHAAGSCRVGMCDSRHEGGVWALKNLSAELIWEKLKLEIPENVGEAVIATKDGEIYAIGKEAVGKGAL